MPDSSQKTRSLIAVCALLAIALIVLAFWFYQRTTTTSTGHVLTQPMPSGVPDILRKNEPPPTQP